MQLIDNLRRQRHSTEEDMSEQVDSIMSEIELMIQVEDKIEDDFREFQTKFSKQLDKLIVACNEKYGTKPAFRPSQEKTYTPNILSSPSTSSKKMALPPQSATTDTIGKGATPRDRFSSPSRPEGKHVKVAFG
jgi:hypothetical protein